MQRRRLVSGREARIATIALLVLQIGGCVADLATGQRLVEPVFCMAARDNPALEATGLAAWLLLSSSWLVGLAALGFAQVRPIYWALLLLAPVGLITQHVLLERQILHCDGP